MQWLLLLGIATGMRTMTPIAVLCWFVYLGRTPVHGWAIWAAHLASAIVFSVMAVGEYVGDTLPQCPNRTSAFPAISRLVFGAIVGALGANVVHEPAAGGVILGALGAAIGTWGGFRVRATLTRLFGRDLPAALLGSTAALLFALWAAHKLALDVVRNSKWWV